MTATLNRPVYFAAVRAAPFPGKLSEGQVSGMQTILDACPVDLGTDALAYCLATAFHETARTMLPVKEYGGAAYYTRMYDIQGERPAKAKELGNLTPGDGALFCGRGYVQLTGRSNYARATKELWAAGYLDKALDLTLTPDMAMTADIAAPIMFLGMQEGWFTGKKLATYFPAEKSDPVNARRIINGTDKADLIASYFFAFRDALRAADHRPGAVSVAVPTPKVETTPLSPVPKLPPVAVSPSLGSKVGNWLYSKLARWS